MKKTEKSTVDRREFLRTLGAGAGLAAVTATPMATEAVAAESDADKRKARYRETDHVKTFYRVNRYPS
jgi:predicted RNA methylase